MIGRLVAIAAGLWLMASPSLLDYGQPAATIDRIVGPIAASLSVVAISEVTRELRWTTIPLGLVLVAAPLPFGYEMAAAANSIVCGLVLAATAFLTSRQRNRQGGGWRALIQ